MNHEVLIKIKQILLFGPSSACVGPHMELQANM